MWFSFRSRVLELADVQWPGFPEDPLDPPQDGGGFAKPCALIKGSGD